MINFNNTTGKNKGKLQLTKLAKYLGKSEGTLRALRKRRPKELEVLHLGSLCQSNSISEDDLANLKDTKENKDKIDNNEK